MADTLDSDFFSFQDQLGDVERAHILAIREFCETEVRPIADDYWVRAEFPSQLIPGLARLGLFGSALDSVRQFENSAVFRGWAALELARMPVSPPSSGCRTA